MGRRAGAYKSDKRKKELTRQKKQEEKRQKRFLKGLKQEDGTELPGTEQIEEETVLVDQAEGGAQEE